MSTAHDTDTSAPVAPESAPAAVRSINARGLRDLFVEASNEAAAYFAPPRSEQFGPELIAAQREVILSRTIVLIWISTFVMPTTIGSFVWFLARPQFPLVMAVVGAAVAVVLVHRQLILRGYFDRHYHAAMVFLVGGVFGPTGATVLQVTRDAQADFFFAFFLIYFAFTALFPADVKWILATSATLVASYIGVHAAFHGGLEFSNELVSSLIYLMELTFIGVVLNRVICNLFFDERRAQMELGRANAGLRELDKAKTAFFANISHELRTPLTLVLTPLTHLLTTRAAELPRDVASALDGMRGNANRLLRMVNMLLDFSRLEAGQSSLTWNKMVLDDVLRHVTSLFHATAAQRGVAIRFESATSGLTVTADGDKVEQILVNLVGNALKFTPSGGSITLSSRRIGSEIELAIVDTGVGIAPEHQELVFRRFAQLDSGHKTSVRGTGIGLSVVREFARLMGGDVTLRSEVGKGSTFCVILPVHGGDTDNATLRSSEDSSLASDLATSEVVQEREARIGEITTAGPDKPWVLVVDDNPQLVDLVASILSPDYNLRLANCGEDALDLVARHDIDLVVSDVMMPGISGLELCRRLKSDEATRFIPVVLLTARGGSTSTVEGLEQGADDYIGKPFDPAELRARVRSLFDKQQMIKRLGRTTEDLKGALHRLKSEEVKLVASEKLRTLGDLAAGIFHELHNYLNMIHNGAIPLQENVEDILEDSDEELRQSESAVESLELIQLILDAALAARSITGELKIYAHQGGGQPVRSDLHELIRSNVRMFGRMQGNLSVEYDFMDEPAFAWCVPSRLILVFTNLVKNAFEAMESEGVLTIASRRDGDTLVIHVSDTGPGVPEVHRAKLFEPFHTTKAQGVGLGLGLSLACKVVHELDGQLTLDPGYMDGARFVITLPYCHARPSGNTENRPDDGVPVEA